MLKHSKKGTKNVIHNSIVLRWCNLCITLLYFWCICGRQEWRHARNSLWERSRVRGAPPQLDSASFQNNLLDRKNEKKKDLRKATQSITKQCCIFSCIDFLLESWETLRERRRSSLLVKCRRKAFSKYTYFMVRLLLCAFRTSFLAWFV